MAMSPSPRMVDCPQFHGKDTTATADNGCISVASWLFTTAGCVETPTCCSAGEMFSGISFGKNSRWSLKPGVRPGETSSKLYSCGKHHPSLPSLGGKTSLTLEWKPKQTPKPGSMIFMVFDDLRIQHPHCYNIKNIAVAECDNSRVSEWEKQVDTSHQEAVQPRHQLLLVRSNKNTL